MTQDTFQTFLAKLSDLFPELVANLNPPVDEAQLERLDRDLPFTLPDDVRSLYRLHNGESERNGEPSGIFFGLPWLSLEGALSDWQMWHGLADGDFSDIDQDIVSVPEGHIKKNYINTRYFPISRDGGGNNIVIDLDPGAEGVKGQVINYGRDEDTRYVIAPSLEDFLAFCIPLSAKAS